MSDLEAVRESFFPSVDVKLLLVGESPPRGSNFFYLGQSTLFEETCKIFGQLFGFDQDPQAFLSEFQEAGCYLIDLFKERGAKVANQSQQSRDAAVASVAAVINETQPAMVVAVLRSVAPLIKEALKLSRAHETPFKVVRFPYAKDQHARLSTGLR